MVYPVILSDLPEPKNLRVTFEMFENIMFKVQKVRFMFIQARCDVFGSPERTGNIVGGAQRHTEMRGTERH